MAAREIKKEQTSNIINKVLNLGIKEKDDIKMIRLIRQINGLNLFYTGIAFSAGLIVLLLFSSAPGLLTFSIIQMVATLLYISNFLYVIKRKIRTAGTITIYIFEWHMFSIGIFTNVWTSPALLVIVLFPLLAALVEEPIYKHLVIGLFQMIIFLVIHLFFPELERMIHAFNNITRTTAIVLRVMALIYFPVMGAVIIKIIFNENIRARKKQKEMVNEISIKNRQLEIYAERLKDESQRLLAEVNVAKKIQTMVLPPQEELNKIPFMDIAGYMQTADEVGGDYYDVLPVDNQVIISIGDVTGHGLSSGIIMLMAQTAIRTLAEVKIEDVKEFLIILNRVLYANINRIREQRNMTLALITYRDGKCVVTGQHEEIIICRHTGETEYIDTLNLGFYLGMLPDVSEQVDSYHFELNRGDIICLYSDGITEAVNIDNKQFGMERIGEILTKYHSLECEKIKFKLLKSIYNFIGEQKIFDDISLLLIKQK